MRGWGKETQERIVELFDEAEKASSCAVAQDDAMRFALQRRVRKGEVVSPLPWLFVRASTWHTVSRNVELRTTYLMRGLMLLPRAYVACGATAAFVHGLWVSRHRLSALHLVGQREPRNMQGVELVYHRLPAFEPLEVNGILVTPLAETVADCLREFDLADGLAIADSAARKAGWDGGRLVDELARVRRRAHGMRRALAIASQANPLAESGGESIARAAIIELGYVVPKLQVKIDNPLAPGSFRADGLWIMPGGLIVLLEVDGMEKRVNPEMTQGRSIEAVLSAERQRDSFISATGARLLHVEYRDIMNRRRLAHMLDAFGVPLAESRAGRQMRSGDSAMNGGEPEPNGAVIRNGWLRFMRPQ